MAHLIKQVSEKFQKLQNDFRRNTIEADAFSKISKSQVLQDCKQFTSAQLNDRQCRQLLSQLIYLINQGNKFSDQEQSTLFFQVTRLFQSNNKELRRMVYLMIKEFKDEKMVYVVTQSLMKDITSNVDLYKMNALRVIPVVLDPSNLIQVERYIKNAILDKNTAVASAAILAAIQLFPQHSESIKKLSSDVTAALQNNKTQSTIHFHAQILLHEIKKQDRNSYIKILLEQTKDAIGNSGHFSTIQLIRFIKEVLLTSDLDQTTERAFIDYLTRQTNKSNEMVIIESCKAICELKNISNKDLTQPVTVLGIFLVGTSTVNKYAALKIINKLVSNPARKTIISSKSDIQYLLTDNNKSISSLAVSILLKLCNEEDIESLLNQIYDNLQDMSDEFKIDILNSVKGLVKQIPKKYRIILIFLFNCMKNEGNADFKAQCIDIVEDIIRQFPTEDVRESGLQVLSEYIEDCLVKSLQLKCLSIINKESSKNTASLKMIRLINNRIHLEDSEVRAAAVGTISKFASKQQSVREQVIQLLKHALSDPDEEVRERAFQSINTFSEQVTSYLEDKAREASTIDFQEITYIEKYIEMNKQEIEESEDIEALSKNKIYEFAQAQNIQTTQAPETQQSTNYDDFSADPSQEKDESQAAASLPVIKKDNEKFQKIALQFASSAIFQGYGPLRHISNGGDLTDKNASYLVSYVKYFFDDYVVLEYLVKNKAQDQILKDVKVKLDLNNENIQVEKIVAATEIKEEEASNIFVALARNPEFKVIAFSSQCFLTFQVQDIGANGKVISEYADEYQLDDVQVTISDHLTDWEIAKGKYETELNYLEGEVATQKFKLSYKSVDFAIQEIIKHFSISVCDGTNHIPQVQTEKFHTLKLAGKYLDKEKFLLSCMIAMDSKQGCFLQMNVKSADEELNQDLINTFNN
ncbi:hypothetical protein ABPG74_006252 [Tetrahymena malaccensis]